MSLIQDHANAWLALLAPEPNLTVYDGAVPTGAAAPYALGYFTGSREPGTGNALDGASREFLSRAIFHCVGADQIAARAIAAKVESRLLDIRPVIIGRSCGFIRQESVLDPVRDESTGPVVMDMVTVYRFISEPTP